MPCHDGMIASMKAVSLLRSKEVLADGAVVEMVLWRLPYYNERLKGDHRHLDGKESRYSLS
jgi:hypothetical protein